MQWYPFMKTTDIYIKHHEYRQYVLDSIRNINKTKYELN